MMISYPENRNQKGFTLLEVLVALAILAIGLLATASMQGVAMNSNYIANRMSVANMLGQQVLEELHSRPISDPVLTAAVVGANYDLDPATAGNRITIRGAGVYSATYTTTPNNPINGTTRISVTISYINPANGVVTQTRTFTTFKMVS